MATQIIPALTEIMTEAEEILDKGDVIESEEGILHSEADPDLTVIKEGHREDKTTIKIGLTIGNNVHKSIQITSMKPMTRSPSRDKDRCFSCRQLSNFAKECPGKDTASIKVFHREERLDKSKECHYLYEGCSVSHTA